MFRESLCPSSGTLDLFYCIWFSALDVVAGVVGSREAGRVHSAHGLLPCFPRHQAAHQVLKTVCSNIQSSVPEDGLNDSRNMLS